jgi:hypothetical protein
MMEKGSGRIEEDYFEQEQPLRSGGGLFGTHYKQLLVDHLRDCYRQRRVFREAINDVRSEVLTETERMHAENQAKMAEMAMDIQKGQERVEREIQKGQERVESLQRWILGGTVSTLLVVLGWFITHFGPLVQRL